MTQNPNPARQGKCPGTNRRGEPCGRPAGEGTDYTGVEGALCRFHTGCTPNGEKHNQRLAAEQAAAKHRLELVDVELPTRDPGERLLWLVAMCSCQVEFYARKVQELDDQQLVQGVQQIVETRSAAGDVERRTVVGSTPNVWLRLLNDKQRQLAEVCRDAMRAGVEERMVRLAERQAETMVRVLRLSLAEYGLDGADADRVVARHLRAVE
jgi:hypothetical protein